jgi:hypothetical protein
MVSEVEVTSNQKTAELLWVQSVEGVGVTDFDFFWSRDRRRMLVGYDALC